MQIKQIFHRTLAFGAAFCFTGMALAQDYPSKPIRLVGPEAGGGADFLTRLVAQAMSKGLNQQVIVDSRSGNAAIPVDIVTKASPDGYTLLFYSNAVWMQPLLQPSVRYDPLRDLSPITLAVSTPNVIVVHPSLPASSIADLINLAKAKPGELNYAAGGFGSGNHLAAELFKSMAGINMTYVAYNGAGPGLNAVLAGEVRILVATATSVAPFVKSGRLRALGITTAQPSDLAPGLPTVAATVPGYDASVRFALFAPARTPRALVDRLNRVVVQFVKSPEAREQFFKVGAESVGNSPQELAELIKVDMGVMSKVIKEAGIKPH